MGRNTAIDWLARYREVLVATAVRTVRDSQPTVQATAAERRAWVGDSTSQGGWRAVAIAAGAVQDHSFVR